MVAIAKHDSENMKLPESETLDATKSWLRIVKLDLADKRRGDLYYQLYENQYY